MMTKNHTELIFINRKICKEANIDWKVFVNGWMTEQDYVKWLRTGVKVSERMEQRLQIRLDLVIGRR